MIRRFFLVCLVFTGLAIAVPQAAFATTRSSATIVAYSSPAMFSSEEAAQAHCPRDTVVWLNTPSGIYHYKGERWYGRTKHGAFVCEKEAIAAGDRASESGQ